MILCNRKGALQLDSIDKRDRLLKELFSYRKSKDNKVFIFWQEKQIMIRKGKASEKFLARVEHADSMEAQLIMAKVTGNFKHGNERPLK